MQNRCNFSSISDTPPTPLLSSPSSKAGGGRLTVELVSGKSAATHAEARNPLKLLVPRPRGESVWAYLSNFGGGLLPGDEIVFSISVAETARCFLGTQSSTKIYRSGPKGAVKNHLHAEVASNALLVYAPDVAQGFATSRYIQKQSIHLADESSNLIFLDWYSAGRAARGERWAFSEYTSRTEIRVADRLIFLDSIRLESDSHVVPPLGGLPERMGRINCIATLTILGPELEPHALASAEQIAQAPIAKRPDLLEVASPIPGGAVFRFAGNSVESVSRQLRARLDFIAQFLGDNPFNRKW